MGAVDSFTEREQLERFARRYLIPYIDIGMDVTHRARLDDFLISGQIIFSFPGMPCLRCCNFITDERLAEEARQYGETGGGPQVVWPNGVLASTAIGLMVQLLTPWSRFPSEFNYLEYDGNKSTVTPSFWVELLKNKSCPHHPLEETGDPLFDIRDHSILWEPGTPSEAVLPATAKISRVRALLDQIGSWLRGHHF
jgi:molybdopterin-synthase adenylyltransferase